MNSVFDKDVSFADSEFYEILSIESCRFERKTLFSEFYETPEDVGPSKECRTVFRSEIIANNTVFTDMIVFSGATYFGNISLNRTVFRNDAVISAHTDVTKKTVIKETLKFSSCVLERNLFAYGSDINNFEFLYSEIRGNLMLAHRISESEHLSCRANTVKIVECRMGRDLVLYGATTEGPLSLLNVSIEGDLMLSRYDTRTGSDLPSVFGGPVSLERCTIGSDTFLQKCVFEDAVSIKNTRFGGKFVCMEDASDSGGRTSFRKGLTCSESVFGSNVMFFGSDFDGEFDLDKCEFLKTVYFSKTDSDKTLLMSTLFKAPAKIQSCSFSRLVFLFGCRFESNCNILFSNFDENVMFSTTMNYPEGLSFVGCEFMGLTDFSESHFSSDLSMYGSYFDREVFFANISVGKDFILSRVRTDQGCYSSTTFRGVTDFKSMHIHGMAYLENVVFEQDVFFNHSIFEREVYFSNVLECASRSGSADRFNISSMSPINLNAPSNVRDGRIVLGTVFKGRAVFDYVEFKGAVGMFCCRIKEGSFKSSVFQSDIHFSWQDYAGSESISSVLEDIDFSKSIFRGICFLQEIKSGKMLKFDDATFEKALLLSPSKNCTEVASLSFRRTIFDKDARFDGIAASEDCTFEDAYINGSLYFDVEGFTKQLSFRNGKIFGTVDVRVGGDVDLSDCNLLGSVSLKDGFGKLSLRNANIYGQLDVNWTYLSKDNFVHLSEPDDRTFRMLKENYSRIGRYDEEDNSYVEYKSRHIDQKEEQRVGHKLEKAFGYIGSYGTNPISIGLSMIGAVIVFALIYAVVPGISFGSETLSVFDDLYISTVTFLTMGSHYVPMNTLTRILIIIEGFLGLFSMFYFTLAFARKLLR